MNSTGYTNSGESRDRLKSGAITAAVWAGLLLFLFVYKVTEEIPAETEKVSTMLINFGDNSQGDGAEEPAEQEGSRAAEIAGETAVQAEKPTTEISTEKPKTPEKKSTPEEKIITGKDDRNKARKAETLDKKPAAKSEKSAKEDGKAIPAKSSGKATAANAKTGSGDGKGTAAIGNLLKGKGTKAASQGDGSGKGNAGDPLGGEGSGDSKIGVDRRLTGFIPGTMGRGGAQPAHSCTASGPITISYTVDKAGNVVSAHRSGGISDPCVVSTSVSWVKKYVRAERASTSSTGSYRITF